MEGPPGIGKSTICLELCQKWDELESLKCYSIVLHVFLREKKIQEAKKLEDIFYDYDDIEGLKKSVVAELIDRDGEGVLLILDGFDEIPESVVTDSKCFIMKLIRRSIFKDAARLVTSRPSRSLRKKIPSRYKCKRVLGFTDKSMIKYAEHAFSDRCVLDHFKEFLDSNPVIKRLMCVPLNCTIITQVYPRNVRHCGKQMSNATTQQYLFIILMRRSLRESGKYSTVAADEYRDLPPEVIDCLEKVSGLANACDWVVYHK